MKFDIIVNGRKMGVATVNVEIPQSLKNRHGLGERQILDALKTGQPQEWYCMGDVEVRPSNPSSEPQKKLPAKSTGTPSL